jgi:hypothetical protein
MNAKSVLIEESCVEIIVSFENIKRLRLTISFLTQEVPGSYVGPKISCSESVCECSLRVFVCVRYLHQTNSCVIP